MSQNGKAGRDLVQVGRDYITYIQNNIENRNWGVVILNFLVLSLLGYGLVSGSREVASKVTGFVQGASASNPPTTPILTPTVSPSPPSTHPSPVPTPTSTPSPSPSPGDHRSIINGIEFPQESCGETSTDSNQSWYPVFINGADLSTVRQKFCRDAIPVTRQTGQKAVQVASFTSYDKAQKFALAVGGEVGKPKTPPVTDPPLKPTIPPVTDPPSKPTIPPVTDPPPKPTIPPAIPLAEIPKLPQPDPTKCVITITNSQVALKSQPETFSREVIRVQPGDYTALNYKVTNFGGLKDDGWFQIEVRGRIGWIVDDIWTVNAKTQACP